MSPPFIKPLLLATCFHIHFCFNSRLTQQFGVDKENSIWLLLSTDNMVILTLRLQCVFLQQRAAPCLCARLQLLCFGFINLKHYTLMIFLCVKHCLKKVCLFCRKRKRLYQQLFIYKTVVKVTFI